jgi:diguanylate cyclase (GGDEF)-like protein/PAS domain S-box-containing protein
MANADEMKTAKDRESNKQLLNTIEDFRIVAEDAPVMLWLTNTDGEIIFTNSRWKHFVGVATDKQLSGNAWYESLHPDDRDHCVEIFRNAFVSHHAFEMEYRLRRNDGQYRYIQDRGEPYISNEGSFSGFIGSSTDITEQKNTENQLRQSQRELTRYNQEMQLINELNSYLQVCQTFVETHTIVGHYASRLFSGSTGALYLFSEERTSLEAVTYWGNADSDLELVISPDDCWALRQSRSHIVEKGRRDTIKCDHVLKPPDHGSICTPAIAQGEVIGFLYLEFSVGGDSETEDSLYSSIESQTRITTITADNLAMALVSLKLREALRIQSVRDPLTRLYNRRYMEETLNREIARCKRSGLTLGLVMIDVDYFKNYNDKYGHDVGDLVLSEVAGLLQTKLRESDVACRYGGEEFILIMPDAPEDIVHSRAEQIRQMIEGHEINHKGNSLTNITVSIGVANCPQNAESNDGVIKAADTALYRAKESGRNKVVIAE